MNKLKLVFISLCFLIVAMSCSNTDPTTEETTEQKFLNSVKGKKGAAYIGDVMKDQDISFSDDGKTLTLTVVVGPTTTPAVFTYLQTDGSKKAIYSIAIPKSPTSAIDHSGIEITGDGVGKFYLSMGYMNPTSAGTPVDKVFAGGDGNPKAYAYKIK